jgi:hypothetical protein
MANLTRASGAKSEYLRTSTWLAELELEAALRSNRQLHYTLEHEGVDMRPSDRVLMQARLVQSDINLATKTKTAREKQEQLDDIKRMHNGD